MPTTIAVAGKGGTGKTAISALLIHFLSRIAPPVLAVDGDPAVTLNQALGLPLNGNVKTIGEIREHMEKHIYSASLSSLGVSKQEWVDARIREALIEEEGYDLLIMGRSEGTGCYCAVNHFLRVTLARLSKYYRFVVMDNEAGMEHISRQTTNDIDTLLIIANPTVPGIMAAVRTQRLIRELRNNVRRIYLVLNRAEHLNPKLEGLIKEGELELLQVIGEDPYIGSLESKGKPLTQLPDNSPLKRGVHEILLKLRFASS